MDGTGRGGMTHRIRGSFGEHPEALCGAPEPELLVDADDAVTCSRCRSRVVVRLASGHAGLAFPEVARLYAAWAALDAAS